MWKINKDGACSRCQKDRLKRRKSKIVKPAKFSGIQSIEIDMGPKGDLIRHNNMHFSPVPPYLQNLSMAEKALIAKITVCINVHLLRHGMLSAKGHCVSIPQSMSIATHLPQLPDQIGIVVLKKKGNNSTSKKYAVQRTKVEQAIKGLCYGFPNGGLEIQSVGTSLYTGPNCGNVQLNGRYFEHFPNRYYADVEIEQDRIDILPQECAQLPGLKVVEVEKDINEEDKGPSPDQFFIPFNKEDETVTASGLTCPIDPKDADKELNEILKKLTGSKDILKENGVASANWNHTDQSLPNLRRQDFLQWHFLIYLSMEVGTSHLISLLK